MKSDTHKIYVIGGPTASGKSAFALDIAAKKNGVIINADSMQIYNDLPILTAQPPAEDLKQAPHKLYSHLHPNEACSAGNWREIAEDVISQTLENGQTPIICGGSGLYIKALIEGLSPMPDIPQDIRDATVQRHKALGAEKFFAELEVRDPIMAARFHAGHKARIIRAMEVLDATGQSLAQWQELPLRGPPENWVFDISLILPERETLYDRCNRRFEIMLDQGGLDEVIAFDSAIEKGTIKPDAPLTKALGVTPLRRYIHEEISKNEAITLAQTETRKYAKRQVTWFNHQVKDEKHIENIRIIG